MNIMQPDRATMAIYYETMLELGRIKFQIARQEIKDIALDRDHWKRTCNQMRLNLIGIAAMETEPGECKEMVRKIAEQDENKN